MTSDEAQKQMEEMQQDPRYWMSELVGLVSAMYDNIGLTKSALNLSCATHCLWERDTAKQLADQPQIITEQVRLPEGE